MFTVVTGREELTIYNFVTGLSITIIGEVFFDELDKLYDEDVDLEVDWFTIIAVGLSTKLLMLDATWGKLVLTGRVALFG